MLIHGRSGIEDNGWMTYFVVNGCKSKTKSHVICEPYICLRGCTSLLFHLFYQLLSSYIYIVIHVAIDKCYDGAAERSYLPAAVLVSRV